MKVSKMRLLAAAGALVAVAMVGTGCSAGGSSSGSSSGPSVKDVKIGIGAPITAGATALGVGMEHGAKLAIEQANASETVKAAGLKFSASVGDDQGDPKTGVTVANTFASDPDLVGVMGHLNSGVSIPASKVYSQKKIVMISPASTNPALTQQGLKNTFRVCTTDAVQGPAAAGFASKLLKFKTVYVVDDSTPYGEGLASAFASAFAGDGGKVVGTPAKTSDKDTDFNALVTKIKATNPDFIYYGGIYNAGALFAKQARDGGIKVPFMGGDGLFDQKFIDLATPAAAEGDFATSVGFPTDKLPAGQEYLAAYDKLYPGQKQAAYDAYAYDATNVIINATVAAAKSVGVDKVTSPAGRDEIIKNVAATNTQGVTGAIAFDANGDTTNKAITLYTVKGGAWITKALPQ